MPASNIFLRITNNGEKIYAEKLGRFFSGLFFRANLFETSPGMIASMALKASSASIGYAIDPMTYIFAVGPESEVLRGWRKVPAGEAEKSLREDLRLSRSTAIDPSWTKAIENPGKRDGGKVEIFGMRQSFRSLADKTLGTLAGSVGNASLSPDDFNSRDQVQSLVTAGIDYQLSALDSTFDDRKKGLAAAVPRPSHVFCPYFRITTQDELGIQQKIWAEFDGQFSDGSATVVICTNLAGVTALGTRIVSAATAVKAGNVAVWVEDFNEEDDASKIRAYADFMKGMLRTGKAIINMYGSGYSMLLSSRGLSTVVSCGHGESKPVESPSGRGYPVSKYYIPSLWSRRTVAEAMTLLGRARLGQTRDAFLREVCSCTICKEVIRKGSADLASSYGALGEPRQTKRGLLRFPTGSALEMCKFHYLINRVKEYQKFSKTTPATAQEALKANTALWAPIPNAGSHLGSWQNSGV